MTAHEFAKEYYTLTTKAQDRILETLKETLPEEEYKTTVKFLGFYKLLNDAAFFNAVQTAVGEAVYEELRNN